MQIDKLQIELRPRTNAQALDLGFSLLHSHAGAAYMAFLALWLPLVAVCAVLTLWLPELSWAWLILAWWFKPLLERAPLYVLSRQVFGTAVTWQEAVRAWPGQLGGGWFRLITWGRPISAGRGLWQPVWQLEGARGGVASARRSALGKNGTASSAVWFGVVCAHLEFVLQLGALGFIGIFAADGKIGNPFMLFANMVSDTPDVLTELLTLGAFALSTALIAPVYTACCFTLYLNRRASMEAWDLEIKLRQIKRPQAVRARGAAPVSALLVLAGAGMLLALAGVPAPVSAAPAASGKPVPAQATPVRPPCERPKDMRLPERGPLQAPEQARIRQQIDQVYAHSDLRGYECVESWELKERDKKKEIKKEERKRSSFDMNLIASILKVLFIALAIGAVAWVLYRYRHHFPSFERAAKARVATEIGGLNIRAESLPPDVTTEVRALWARGEQRAALALLYRATLSRLVTEDALALRQGNTEGDCLRLARQAVQRQQLSSARLEVAIGATSLWLGGAYAARWPDDDTLLACCAAWDAQFGALRETAA
ncbi:hypothetical protein CR152_30605 [Massilia violaceinigra]|uniref:DUF4129 domain-containing protein n=1 Tax=Massilia violaceinigra TaxID=2045208 RepID=A0A2D2DTS1_9BURK|nr:hypothetical protein [Massilia violaceinigra]ATQ78378.1 hypothetical protein CR152_30605 [Massilia violaceinigra]